MVIHLSILVLGCGHFLGGGGRMSQKGGHNLPTILRPLPRQCAMPRDFTTHPVNVACDFAPPSLPSLHIMVSLTLMIE